MSGRAIMYLAMSALAALIAWPFVQGALPARNATALAAAPVLPDYRYRDKTIAFYEERVRSDRADQISMRALAGEYLKRFRERGDVGDLQRAEAAARRALQLQPNNAALSRALLVSALSAQHRFHEARPLADQNYRDAPRDPATVAMTATLAMELGDYDAAARDLAWVTHDRADASLDTAQARYDELTGKLGAARDLVARASTLADAVMDNPAEYRAWYHFRAGELAFAAGDPAAAEREEHAALAIFPGYNKAYNVLARLYGATHRWQAALDAATRGSDAVPLPDTLGYKADAQRALGDGAGAAQTEATIGAIERIGNALHVSDRLLAVYYCEHDEKLPDALAIAQRELAVRDDLYVEDTLAWAAYKNGRWETARRAIAKALRFDTEDAKLQYHAGMIALHFGERDEAKRRLTRALMLNAQFHPAYADDARAQLAKL